jgi:hypothetical protein
MNRYIKVPLIIASIYATIYFFTSDYSSWKSAIWGFGFGALFGLFMVLMNDYRVRGIRWVTTDDIFNVHQRRGVYLRCPYNKAFDLCLESIGQLESAKVSISIEDKENGKIEVRIGKPLIYSTLLTFQLKKIAENLFGVELYARPWLKLRVLDDGESLKIIERVNELLVERDRELNQKVLTENINMVPNLFFWGERETKAG